MYELTLKEKQSIELIKNKYNIKKTEFIAKGFSSIVFKVKIKNKKKSIALKIEREKSPRNKMIEREAFNLMKANSVGIAPKLLFYDKKLKVIGMQFIEGITLNEFIFSKPKKKELFLIIKELLRQAKKLDEINLSHGQLAGKMKNILITKKKGRLKPVIIDFEKASIKRKARNFNQLNAALFLNPHSRITKEIKKILSKKINEFF